ncbi:hypothetical protein QJQ45_021641 [Haematococcus lacustris]|nr:hypothetical protein QJQ45_021641 [Haematococcus lacustris]
MAKKKRKGSDKKHKVSRSAQGKQRQDRRDGWTTRRRQVIKVPEGAVLRGCKKTRRKLREHLRLRAEIHSQLRFIASLFVLRICLTCLVGYPTPGSPSAPQPPAVQPPKPPDAPPLPPLPPRAPAQPAQPAQPASMECDTDSDSESDCGSEPEPQSDSDARLAALAPAAPTGPPLPLDCEDPLMLRQLKDFCKFFANPNFKTCYNQLQRRHVRNRHPMLMPAFEDPSNQALVAKLQELGSIYLAERIVKLYAKAARAQLGWSGDEAQLFIRMACGYGINAKSSELKAATLDKGHPDQGALPAKGKEYPGLGYKRVRDKPPKAAVEADKYFKPTPATDGSQEPILEVQLRGRQLRGRAIALPPGYTGLLLSTSSQGQGAGQGGSQGLDHGSQGEGQHHGLQPEPVRTWKCEHGDHFDSVTYWNHDATPGKSDTQRRVLDWLTVASEVHAREQGKTRQDKTRGHGVEQGSAALERPVTAAVTGTAAAVAEALEQRKHADKQSSACSQADLGLVIKVPEGAVLRGCKKTRRKLREHLRLRAEIHSQLRFIASLFVLRIFLTCLVGYPTPGSPSAPQPPAVQPPQPPDAPPLPPLPPRAPAQPAPAQPASMECATDSDSESDCGETKEYLTVPCLTWCHHVSHHVCALCPWLQLEEQMAELSMKRHGCAKQLVVFFGAASIGTSGGWGADAVLRACRKVVCRPRGKDQDGGRLVLVDEHRTSRVSSAVNGKQPCEVELNTLSATRPAGWKPPAGQVEGRLVRPAWSQERGQPVRGLMWCPVVAPRRPPQAPRSSQEATPAAASEPGPSTPPPAKRSKGKGKAAKAKPAPQPGRWLDRDCNAALNMQRIGESRWRPLELCFWPEQGALPAKGKEYPGLGYKRLRDKPPKAQQQQQQPAVAQ